MLVDTGKGTYMACVDTLPEEFMFCYSVLFFSSLLYLHRYLVTNLMGADLNNIVKCQKLTDDHIQFLIYQLLRGLKVLSESRNLNVVVMSQQSKCCKN